jgi:hypothetical protein
MTHRHMLVQCVTSVDSDTDSVMHRPQQSIPFDDGVLQLPTETKLLFKLPVTLYNAHSAITVLTLWLQRPTFEPLN